LLVPRLEDDVGRWCDVVAKTFWLRRRDRVDRVDRGGPERGGTPATPLSAMRADTGDSIFEGRVARACLNSHEKRSCCRRDARRWRTDHRVSKPIK
jgi:hypothetical protein